MRSLRSALLAMLAAGQLFTAAAALAQGHGDTIKAVRDRGALNCGVNAGLHGFSSAGADGRWAGLDVDFCRAVAAAVLGDAELINFIPLNASTRFDALRNGEIDLLSRNSTWTFTRDSNSGLRTVGVIFYDGGGFLARRDLGAARLSELPSGAKLCFQTQTTTERNVANYVSNQQLNIELTPYHSLEELKLAFFGGRCDAITGDRSAMASIRAFESPVPELYVLFDEIMSKEPLGPMVRRADTAWADLTNWVLVALLAAEEQGISSQNAAEQPGDRYRRWLMGFEPGVGAALGLDDEWVRRVILQVGNYAEVFDRNVGAQSAINMSRGLNALARDGGLMAVPSLR